MSRNEAIDVTLVDPSHGVIGSSRQVCKSLCMYTIQTGWSRRSLCEKTPRLGEKGIALLTSSQ